MFSGVHSDVGGMFEPAPVVGPPLKWIAQDAVPHGLWVRPQKFKAVQQVDPAIATGPIHKMNRSWRLLGTRNRVLPKDAVIHDSVAPDRG